jgi:hypothetical protein
LSVDSSARPGAPHGHELVRITPQGAQSLARDVLAFDVGVGEDIVYSNETGVFALAAGQTTPEPLADLNGVEQVVIHW